MFCKVKGYEELGIGKVEELVGKDCIVSFFSSPTSHSHKITVDKKNVGIVSLGQQTRVYWKNEDSNSWKVGRVLDGEGEKIFVQFPSKVLLNIPAKDINVRWDKPIDDPTPYLANFINETPLFSIARSKFYRSLMAQRNASDGMSGLLSSSIELEEHQVGVVRQVLSDSVQRYLLADEVGLGKTIEAGVLIRQHILDNPNRFNVVVLVPTTLGRQWASELNKRFHLKSYLGKELNVLSYDIDDPETLMELKELLLSCTMLVIDEVHHLVEGISENRETPLYKIVREVCSSIENLLLLSATPVLGNELGFLAMLHLLDPTIYDLNSIEEFKKKISNRQALAQIVAQLKPENVFFLEDSLDQLNQIFPKDKILDNLSKELRSILESLPEPENEKLITTIDRLHAHVSETYKLHRRILRNRRSRVQGLTPDRIGLKKLLYDTPDYETIVDRMNEWRSESFAYTSENDHTIQQFKKIFWEFVDALICDPQLLLERLRNRINGVMDECSFFPDEASFLERIISVCELVTSNEEKNKCLFDKINSLSNTSIKFVVFCSHRKTADNLFESLLGQFKTAVVRHSNSNSDWNSFLTIDSCKILVCDSSSEEGLNLQGGKKFIIHYDIPLSPNRIEQRIGRLDRYGSSQDIVNYALIARQNNYEMLWVNCLDDGFLVFEQSIASLQYLINEKMEELHDIIFDEGANCFDQFTARLQGGEGMSGLIDEELRRIEVQDSLDGMHQTCDEMLSALEDVDEEWEQIQKDTDSWVEQCLMFEKIPSRISKPYPPDKVFRYQYSYGRRINTLFPLGDFLLNFLPTIEMDAPGSSAKTPRTYPYSFRRQTSVSKETRLLRYGANFIKGIYDFTQKDDRGKSFALWRFVPQYNGNSIADVFFRFDFVIETSLETVREICKMVPKDFMRISSNSIKRQGDMLFSPFIKTIWVDSDKQLVDVNRITEYLEIGYSKRPRQNGMYDTNLRPERWEIVKKLGVQEIDYWNDLCFDVRKAVEIHLRQDVDLSSLTDEAVKIAKKKDAFHFTQMEARIAQLDKKEALIEKGRLAIEKNIREALYKGTLEPKIVLDTIGVVFLSELSISDQ